ncbi:hypothetical protein TrLO_g4981 [Triparma laevis f. longispina]|uniref:Uncharacterized protein n=1 Tax=Triparma laevis f. longispina TaxID=1714387 RepID=A0A9W7E9C1_9STRA|nr:hypothetical protein TrLO_g4981 [Triparma laevis f. longispina]
MCTYDNEKGVCTEVEEGMDSQEIGMSLKNLKLDPGYWRTGLTSIDVCECPVAGACVGGNNSTNYCREGHEGPYSITILILGVGAALSYGLLFCFKKMTKDRKGLGKRLKNGVKILFVAAQITVCLPNVIPAMALPENVKEVIKAASYLNVDLFNMVSVGCWTGGVGYYDKTLYMTLATIG